jgi:hypothetical protein
MPNASVSVLIGAELGKSFKGAFGSANKQLSSLGSAIKKVTDRANQIEAFRNSSRATKEASVAYRDAKQKLDSYQKKLLQLIAHQSSYKITLEKPKD